jgi:hypothetical protein
MDATVYKLKCCDELLNEEFREFARPVNVPRAISDRTIYQRNKGETFEVGIIVAWAIF